MIPFAFRVACCVCILAPGGFAAEPTWSSSQVSALKKGIASIAADLDQDGQDEVIYVGSNGMAVWTRHPEWTANNLGNSGGSGDFLMAVGVGDFNGDGWLDIVAPSDKYKSGPGRLHLWINPANGSLSGNWQHITIYSGLAAHHQNDLAVGDLDGDGKLDVAIRSRDANNRVIVAIQNEINDWTVRTFATGESIYPEGITIGDVDGDGWNDIVLSGVYWSRPGGWRTGSPVSTIYDEAFVGKAVKCAFADIDGDGIKDLYVGAAERWDVYLAWYKRMPNGSLQKTIIKDNFGRCHSVVWADVDGDGALDLITGQTFSGSHNTLVFYNRNSGASWVQQQVSTVGKYFASAGDFDGDGDIDITGPVEYNDNTSPWVHYNQLNPVPGGGDTQAPSKPGSFLALATGQTTIALSWTASTDNVGVVGYEVKRGSSLLGTVSGTSYADSGLNPGSDYVYTVQALDAAGNRSEAGIASATTSAGDGGDPLPAALVWWRFEEGSGNTVADLGLNGWTGSLLNGPLWTDGFEGGAVLLSNPNLNETQHVSGGSRAIGELTALTVSMWMRNDRTGSYQAGLISHLKRQTSTYMGGYELGLNGNRLVFSKGDPSTQTFNVSVSSEEIPELADGQWHHVAAVWDANSGMTRIYLDCVEVASGYQPSASLGGATATLRVGMTAINAREFHGAIDEVRIHDQALDAESIAALAALAGPYSVAQ